jgi:glycosyltransferase involved in cell wall biosynthesis
MTIWVDVSTLSFWSRPPVGIVRVELECVKFYLQNEARFCRYYDSGYREISAAEIVSLVEKFDSMEEKNVLINTQVIGRPGIFYQSIKNTSLRKIPIRYHRAIKILLKISTFLTIKIKYLLIGMIAKVKNTLVFLFLKKNQHLFKKSTFEIGDWVISLGPDWDFKNTKYMYQLHKEGVKICTICYDVIPIKFPEWAYDLKLHDRFIHYFADLSWYADLVFCISESSKRDLVSFCDTVGAPIPKTAIFHLGSDLKTNRILEDVLNKYKLKQDSYILYVSTIERRKNHQVILDAYKGLLAQGIFNLPTMVFVGMKGWGVSDMLREISANRMLNKYIKILNDVSDSEVASLFDGCKFSVYPSSYEGWGLPVAESLSRGKFCIASDSSSMMEVGLNFVEYISPFRVDLWANAIYEYSHNSDLLIEKELMIKNNYSKNSWNQAFQKFHSMLLIS